LAEVNQTFRKESQASVKAAQDSLGQLAKETLEKTTTACDGVRKTVEDTKAELAGALKEAVEYKEKTKLQFEQSREHFQNQAMTAFGSAFREEAKVAAKKALLAGIKSWVGLAIAIGTLGLFVVAEAYKWIQYTETSEAIRWSVVRVSVLAVCVWFIGHYFRERKSFLHVAVANRHRANLCDAYVAFSLNMTEGERARYLEEIIPNLSVLGKTGFITREEIVEGPTGQLLKECIAAIGIKGK
jgi:hypothetical protein